MRVCASLGRMSDLDAAAGDMVEIRLDILGCVPDTKGKETVVTFRGPVDLGVLPEGFDGIIDIGEEERPSTGLRVMASHHDLHGTPGEDEILSILGSMDADICKAAFTVRDMKDLMSILNASRAFGKEHVVLGMGSLGTVTRIRQGTLGNRFTFGYVSVPTAPGQLSAAEMSYLGDDCMILGITGMPLGRSLSPRMHDAALRHAGIKGIYLPFETPDLKGAEEVIRGYGIRGMNVTVPYKEEVIGHLDSVDGEAEAIGAVNTIVNDRGVLKGYNTDIAGMDAALRRAGCVPDRRRVLVMGSGGSARTCIHYMTRRGCDVTVVSRNRRKGDGLAKEFGAVLGDASSVRAEMYDIIVNCTPIGMYSDGPYPVDISGIGGGQTVFDMVYGTTALTETAAAKGCRTVSGADMLAAQGAESFRLWTGADGMFGVMRRELD